MKLVHQLWPFSSGRNSETPVVLIPNQWNGSVQQYYHFLLGYLAPLLMWSLKHPDKKIAVRDCGPMNRWFELLPGQLGPEIMTVGDVLHVLAGNLRPHRVLRGMDDPDAFSAADLNTFAEYTRKRALEQNIRSRSYEPIVVTDRASSDEYFSSSGAEWPESGSQKRSVPNLNEIVRSWSRSDLRIIDAAHMDIYEQIIAHSNARVLIGQHGAGLTNMIWMSPGGWVIEILPPMPADATNIFSTLAATLGLHHVAVQQDSVHAPVNPDELFAAMQRAAG